MFSLNRADMVGYQTQPVTVRKTPSGTSVTDLNVVVPYSFQTEKGEMLTGRSFHTVTVWGSMADVAGQYVKAGSQIFISGRLQTDSWDDQESGEKRSKTKIVALDLILLDPKEGQREAPTGTKLLANAVNRAQVIGNITKDPEMRTTTTGQSVLSIGVATNEKWRDKGSTEIKERVEFHNIVLWGDMAREAAASLKKGTRVYVSGRIQTRSWQTQTGQKRTTTEIVADQLTMLGVKNADALASVQADSVVGRSNAPANDHSSDQEMAQVSVSAGIPEIKYESEIKAEDLPF